MLWWISEHILKVRIRNEDIRKSVGYKYWRKDERESFKMVWTYAKTCISEPVRKIESWSSGDLKRGRGISEMTWRTWVDNDIKDLDLWIEMVGIKMNGEG